MKSPIAYSMASEATINPHEFAACEECRFIDYYLCLSYSRCMTNRLQLLDSRIFVKDENDPEFRARMVQRAEDALKPENRLPLSELKRRLLQFQKAPRA